MNNEIFSLINNLAYKNSTLDAVMIFFSKYVPLIFMAAVAAVFFIGIAKKDIGSRQAAVNTCILAVINLVIGSIIGGIYYVDRPFVHNKVNLLFPHVQDASFPSDHAVGTMSIAMGLKKHNRASSILLTILSLVVGFSRVYVGHHYPADVIGAYIIVFITSYLYNLKLRSIAARFYEIIERKIAVSIGLKL